MIRFPTAASSRRLGTVLACAAATLLMPAAVGVGQAAAPPIGAYTTTGAWSFASAPNLHPPKLLTDAPTIRTSLARGDFLLDNLPNVAARGPMTGEGGPLIVDSRLQPVWFYPVGTGLVSANLQQEAYQGKPVLVWWQGVITTTGGTKSGEVVVVDQRYRRIATLRAKAPWVVSLHDAVISGSDIWVTVYRDVSGENLRAYGGPARGTVYDAGVQEYDLATGALLYTWDALNPGGAPNVSLSASEQTAAARPAPGGAWAAYYLNSAPVLPGTEILVSMRNTSAAYLIDTQTNQTIWTLGGKTSSFRFASGARFAWQHDVQLVSGNEVSLFNDNCCAQLANGHYARPNGPSEGMLLRLNTANHTVSLAAAYPHRPTLNAYFLGSMQPLPNGNALVGWGQQPYFTEYAEKGKELLDVRWPYKDSSYRALYTGTWIGTPYYRPSGAMRKTGAGTTVYASWNGATQVARWELLAGSSAVHLRRVATVAETGFETAIALKRGSYKAFEVRALNAGGQTIGTSAVFPRQRSSSLPGSY